VRRRMKHYIRRGVDRLMVPYFTAQTAELARLQDQANSALSSARSGPFNESSHRPIEAPTAITQPSPLTDFNLLLHALRSVELGRMPRAERVLLSVGCSDRSYFDWIEHAHGLVPEHWGVEFYRPEPDSLPSNARWIVASASSMPMVADGSVDVIFSGQNLEHLSVRDLYGFLRESRRVLRPGGSIVIDSPNRLVTAPLMWRHPEHVVELSPGEARELLAMAGFETTSCRGQWLCADDDGTLLPLLPVADDGTELLRRAISAADQPDRSFCWWLEATVSADQIDEGELYSHIDDLVARLWRERVNRGADTVGTAFAHGGHLVEPGVDGRLYRAGPIPLFPGDTTVRVTGRGVDGLTVRVHDSEFRVLGSGVREVSLTLDRTEFGVWVDIVSDPPLGEPVTIFGVDVDTPAIRG